jgi:vancomycin resistance protein YoaR
MKKKFHLILILAFIICFTSCSNKTPVQETQEISFDKGTVHSTPLDSTPPLGSLQSTPEALVPAPGTVVSEVPTPPKPVNKPTRPKKSPIGSYSTPLLNKNRERVINIALAAKKVDGFKVKQGETFSFNDVVGERTVENGFKIAAVIVKGEYEKGVGGGVCQLSTTIFNAADKSGLEIIERHSHSKNVNYVPVNRDASVSYPYLDFKFKNTKDYPIIIKTKAVNGRVYASIWKA